MSRATAKDYINLLPPEVRASSVPRLPAWAGVLAAAALIWAVLFGLEYTGRARLLTKLGAVQARKASVEQQLAALRAELGLSAPGAASQHAALVRSLLGERVRWSEVFTQFSRIVPRGVWFDSLEGTATGKAEVKIKGGAVNYLAIADFMLALEQSGYFEQPQLLFAQKASVQGQEIVGFEIQCGIRKVLEARR